MLYVIMVLRHQLRGSMLFDIWRHEFPTSVATEWPMWLVNRFVTLGSVSTAVRVAPYAAVALAFAIVVTFTGRRRFSMALALIIIITLSAGAAGFYPFVGRFLFFAAPVALLLMFGEIGRWAKSRSPVVHQSMAAIASVALIYAGVSLANRSIFKGFDFDDARGAYIHIRNRMEPGDAIHGSPAAQPTLRFYASDLASRQRMSSEWPVGEARVWFVFFQPTEAGFDRESVRAARRSGDLRESVSRGLHKATMWQLSPQAESLQP